MPSVTQICKTVKQPYGGYLSPQKFQNIFLSDEYDYLNPEEENIPASLVGMTIDYLTRFYLTNDAENAFIISLQGAKCLDKFYFTKMHVKQASGLVQQIKNINDSDTIIAACQLVGFDTAFRAGVKTYFPVSKIKPDSKTIQHIQIMMNRMVQFFEKYGPIVMEGFIFPGAYTPKVTAGDGDFLTAETL